MMNAIDDFELIRPIGVGSGGVVWEVRDKGPSRALYALKQPSPNACLDRFRREVALLWEAVGQPGIVQIVSSGEVADRPYFVMEYAVHGSVYDHIRSSGSFSFMNFLLCLSPVVDALSWLHRKEIVHRDIKPTNILSSTGGFSLADLGIARVVKEPITKYDERPGTPLYMAPEQSNDPQNVDHRADQYALALVILTMLGLDRSTPKEWTLPNSVRRCLRVATNSNPKLRFPSIRKFYEELTSAGEGKLAGLFCSPREMVRTRSNVLGKAEISTAPRSADALFFMVLYQQLVGFGVEAEANSTIPHLERYADDPVVSAFIAKTRAQHEAHLKQALTI